MQPTERGAELDQLKSLLVGDEIAALASVQKKLAEYKPSARDLAPAIADALDLSRREKPGALAEATWPLIATGLERSLNENPKAVVDVLFPVIGPLIRKAIAEALKDFAESLNLVMEQSLSPRYLRWRIAAWRAGVPFAEFVLKQTLQYAVEQVFLIQRASGLLIAHVERMDAKGADSDAVSAMLNAIQDFVRDSFKTASDSNLSEIEVGGMTVHIEHGPHAMLALAISGVPRPSIKLRAKETLERLHAQDGALLDAFSGDSSAVPPAIPEQLRALLERVQREPEPAASGAAWLRPGTLLLGTLALAALLLVIAYGYRTIQRSAWLERVAATPGYVVSGESAGAIVLLRDPDAAALASLGDAHGLKLDVRPFRSLDPVLVTARARVALALPSTVTFEFDGATLRARGTVDDALAPDLELRALAIDGVENIDLSALKQPDFAANRAAIATELATLTVAFRDGATLDDSADPTLDAVLRAFNRLHPRIDADRRLALLGQTDGTGAERKNRFLALERAIRVRDALIARGIPTERITIDTSPATPSDQIDYAQRVVRFGLR
jgi:hypothetical protein